MLHPYFTREGITILSVIQHLKRSDAKGIKHSFRFFSGKDFLPSVYLSGKEIAFASHVLDRFRERVSGDATRNISGFLTEVFGSPGIVMRPNNHGEAILITPGGDSLLALTYQESEDEYLFTTCLTVDELQELSLIEPPRKLHFHYGRDFTRPSICEADVRRAAARSLEIWKGKTTVNIDAQKMLAMKRGDGDSQQGLIWPAEAKLVEQVVSPAMWDAGRTWAFVDGVYGPTIMEC